MEWAGGLAFGGGGAMGGKPVAQLGGNMRHVPQALDVAAAALARGEAVPAEAVALLAKPLMPARLYAGMGSLGFALQAANNRCLRRLWDRPYEAEPQMNTDGHR
jgi:hypothetical protein